MSSDAAAIIRPLTQNDLQHLACPFCHASLQLQSQSVLCIGCRRRYPIVDGLPVLLTDRTL